MKRIILTLICLCLLPGCVQATPFIEERKGPDGRVAWIGACFANELPALLEGVVADELISGASLELPQDGLALALVRAADGRMLAYSREHGNSWSMVDLSAFCSGSVGLHEREGTHPVFCVFNPYSSQQPTYHVDYHDGAFQIAALTPQEHDALIASNVQ